MVVRIALLIVGRHLICVAACMTEFDGLDDVDALGRLHDMRNGPAR